MSIKLFHFVDIKGVAGGTASGKTTVCDMIISQLHDQRVVLVNQVNFFGSLYVLLDAKNPGPKFKINLKVETGLQYKISKISFYMFMWFL